MLHLFVKYSNNIVKYYYNKNMFYITPIMFSLLRSSVSHDPPEINLTCTKKRFPIIIFTHYY